MCILLVFSVFLYVFLRRKAETTHSTNWYLGGDCLFEVLAGLGSLGNRSKNALDKITQKNIVKTRLKNRKKNWAQFVSDPPEGQVRLRDVRPLA